MFKSWDFIDPKLAEELSTLNKEMKDLKEQKAKILNNTKLNKDSRNKLLSYNQQCMENVSKMLEKQKGKMVDYLDEQVNVLTKKQIKYDNQDQLSTLVFDHRKTHSSSSGLNKTKNLDETTVEENKISGNLSTTGRLSVKVPSFELHEKNIQNYEKTRDRKYKNLAFREKPRIKRLVKKCQRLKQELRLYKLGFSQMQRMYEEERNKNEQNEELVRLLYEKIHILEDRQSNGVKKLKEQYDEKFSRILQQQKQFDKIRNQNKELLMERKQLFKLMKS